VTDRWAIAYSVLSIYAICCHVLKILMQNSYHNWLAQKNSPSVLWYCWLGLMTCKNRLPYNLHCVGGGVKHCSIDQSMYAKNSITAFMIRRLKKESITDVGGISCILPTKDFKACSIALRVTCSVNVQKCKQVTHHVLLLPHQTTQCCIPN